MRQRGGLAGARLIGRATLRRQWLAIAIVTLLIGIAGAAVLATAAGARRTATVMDRFGEFSNNADIEVFFGEVTDDQMRAFEEDAAIAEVAPLRQFAITFKGNSEFLPAAGALDERFGTVVDRPRVIRGRVPDLAKPNEVAIGETLAASLDLDVGGVLEGVSYSPADVAQASVDDSDPGTNGPPVRLDVVGIVRRPLDLSSRGAKGGVVVMTPAFTEANIDRIGSWAGTLVRARATNSAAEAIDAARKGFATEETFGITPLEFETEGVQDAIDVLTLALALFALIAGVAAIVVVAILINRQLGLAEREQAQLAALGASRRTRAAAVLLAAAPMIFGGAALAVVGAASVSPWFPIGVARRAEPNSGFDLDFTVLVLGFLAIVLVTLAIAVVAALRVTGSVGATTARPTLRPSRLARSARQAGLAPTTTTGIGFAFETDRGRASVPVRSALVGAIVGVAGVAAVLVYAASFDHLVATPAQHGWSMSGVVRVDDDSGLVPAHCKVRNSDFQRNPNFVVAGIACTDSMEIEGRSVTVWGFQSLRGVLAPSIVRGRAAQEADEITLGGVTLDAIRKRIGDHVTVTSDAGPLDYEIVGQQLLPSPASMDPLPIADNAGVTAEGFDRTVTGAGDAPDWHSFATLVPDRRTSDFPPVSVPFSSEAQHVDVGAGVALELPVAPDELTRIREVDSLPLLLGAFLAFLGLSAVAHTLFVSVRRRGHDLAILRALGFRRSQVRGTIAWEAAALSLVGLVAGIPVGILVGRLAWTTVADNLGVVSSITVPIGALLALGAATLLVVVLIGVVSSRRATRMSPAAALTVE